MGSRAFIDISGQKFKYLTALKYIEQGVGGNRIWDCICICGKHRPVAIAYLRRGQVTSCGCRDKENSGTTTHNMSRTDFYHVWHGIKRRCDPEYKENYPSYAGRGIKVCKRWLKFENFKTDMFLTYKKGLTIERINVNKGYSPKNCKWATRKEQQNNRRNTIYLTINGVSKPLSEWCEIYQTYRELVSYRINKGWDIQKALITPSTPVNKRRCR